MNTEKEQYTQGYQDGLKNRSSAVNLSILLDKVDALHDHLFSVCCSNPIYNAWGQPVDVSLLNDIHEFSRGIRPHMEQPNLTAPAHFFKLRQELKDTRKENETLSERVRQLEAMLNTPRTDEWFEGVRFEAGHQIKRWGSSHDAGKSPADWFWLIGYLAQKAMTAQMAGDKLKALHHTISTGAVMLNWFRAISGESTSMRPGIDGRSGV